MGGPPALRALLGRIESFDLVTQMLLVKDPQISYLVLIQYGASGPDVPVAHLTKVGLANRQLVDGRYYRRFGRVVISRESSQANFGFAHGGAEIDLLQFVVQSQLFQAVLLVLGKTEFFGMAQKHSHAAGLAS